MEEDNYIVLSGEDEPHPGAASGEAPLKSMCDEGRALWRRTNHNVKFILIIVAFAGLSESLAFGSALASYLYMATGACNQPTGADPTDRSACTMVSLRLPALGMTCVHARNSMQRA